MARRFLIKLRLTNLIILVALLYIVPTVTADTLNVLVLNETNLVALPNVNVTVFNATWAEAKLTDSTGWVGWATFTLAAGTYTVNGTYSGYGSNQSSVVVSGSNNFNLTLMIWHLDGYTIRKSFDITGFTSDQTDYPVNLSLNYGTGADGSGSLYFNSTIQSDFDDIRITNWTGAILDHWLTDLVASVSVEMWFEADLLAEDVNTSFWAYYNNSVASGNSDGDATFTFWDDLETDLTKWNNDGVDGTLTLSAAQARDGTYSMRIYDDDPVNGFEVWSDTFNPLTTTVYHVSVYPDTNNEYISLLPADVAVAGGNERVFFCQGNNGQWRYYDGAWHDIGAYAASAWYDVELYVNSTTDTFDAYVDNELLGPGLDFRNVGDNTDRIYHVTQSNEQATRYIDRVFVRKWAGDMVYGSVGPISIFDDSPPPVEEDDIIDWSKWTQQTTIWLIVYCGLFVMLISSIYHFMIGRI